jgi:large subunit ribosomal protein L29
MALLKSKEIRAMRPDDIQAKFKELSDELMHERGVAAMGGAPASPGKIRALRTEIARIHTIMREMEVAKAVKAKPAAPAKEKEGPKKAPAKAKKERKKSDKKEEKT